LVENAPIFVGVVSLSQGIATLFDQGWAGSAPE